MKLRNHQAFTLVELLVVIGIIGMLMALLLPAVLSAQEQARQTQCQKQVKDVTSATLMYVMKKKRFPGYADTWTVSDGAGSTQSYEVGWFPQVLAYLDMEERLRNLREWVDVDADTIPDFLGHVPLLSCPSDPPDLETPYFSETECGSPPNPVPLIENPTSYAVNAGKPDNAALDPLPRDAREDAIFHDRRAGAVKVTVGLDDIRDGQTQTMLISENVDLTNWNSVGAFANDATATGVTEPHQGVVFSDDAANATATPANVTTKNFSEDLIAPYDCQTTGAGYGLADNLDYSNARPSSFHQEGFMVGYADGRAKLFFVDQALWSTPVASTPDDPYRQYKRMMTPDRGD